MYNSSPAKRGVIEEQLKKWFKIRVIEASKSPWSTPVVIVYWSSKARFCVDYCKLNVVTIPNKFPIPRQSKFLSALSGVQVLLCLVGRIHAAGILSRRSREDSVSYSHRIIFGLRNSPSIFQQSNEQDSSALPVVVCSSSYQQYCGVFEVL